MTTEPHRSHFGHDPSPRTIDSHALVRLGLGGTASPVSSRWTFALFTGADSEANLRLYARCGYREVRREALPTGPGLIHLHKPR